MHRRNNVNFLDIVQIFVNKCLDIKDRIHGGRVISHIISVENTYFDNLSILTILARIELAGRWIFFCK